MLEGLLLSLVVASVMQAAEWTRNDTTLKGVDTGAQASDPPESTAPQPLVDPPHPLITEVLYAVPRKDADANKDGTRSATGDEFVELTNPHGESINLRGYTITDRNPVGKGQLKFTFPSFELAPGETVVVFNGNESSWRGPVGSESARPREPHDEFHGAWVFTMGVTSSRVAFGNGGDWVLLTDPKGKPVHLIQWGTFDETPPQTPLMETAPASVKDSAARATVASGLISHESLSPLPFSPGRFPPPAGP